MDVIENRNENKEISINNPELVKISNKNEFKTKKEAEDMIKKIYKEKHNQQCEYTILEIYE